MTKPSHKGWFLFCPVYIADIHSDCPQVDVRYAPDWFLHANIWAMHSVFCIAGLIGIEPKWPLLITGEVKHGTST